MQVRPLAPDETLDARVLLEANELPTADLEDPSITLLGAFDHDELHGVVGLQTCARAGLLRSLAVVPRARDRGVARLLCERVVELAQRRGLEGLWLLTTTARDYFPRHGFIAVQRDAAPRAIRETAEFSSLCPSNAVVMRRSL